MIIELPKFVLELLLNMYIFCEFTLLETKDPSHSTSEFMLFLMLGISVLLTLILLFTFKRMGKFLFCFDFLFFSFKNRKKLHIVLRVTKNKYYCTLSFFLAGLQLSYAKRRMQTKSV